MPEQIPFSASPPDASGTPSEIARGLAGLHPADIAAALDRLDPEITAKVLGELDTETAADVIIHLEENTLEDVLAILDPPEIAGIATELDSDDAADVVGALDIDKQAEVLSELKPSDRREVEELLQYTDESAGGIMASEVVYVNQGATVETAIETVRAVADEVEEIHNVYVTDRQGRLTGVLPLRALVLARPGARVADVMDPDVVSVSTEMDQEDVADVFWKYDLVAVPVVDPRGKLIGRITVDDIIDVIHEEADEDISRMVGTSDEEIHEDSVLRVSRIRLPWLVIGALGGIASATVMSLFHLSLEKVLALAFFVPVITAMGGNVGLQTSTIIVRSMRSERGLAEEGGSRLLREWRIALLNAAILGVAVLLIVGLWLGDLALAVIVGGSLATVILVAATLGTVMPFALRRVGVDPAVAQGPFVTTLNDVVGILVYLGLASAFIDRLT
jgi:magnesium transporter